MPYILIVITYLGGSAWGPSVSQQEYKTAGSCEDAKKYVLESIDDMNRTNLMNGGTSFRQIVKADCRKK